MKIATKYILKFIIVAIVLSVGIIIGLYFSSQGGIKNIVKVFPTPTQIAPSPTVILSTPSPIEYKISFVDLPNEIIQGGQATFTWVIDGPSKTIHKSAAYFGTISTQGNLTKDVAPAETNYTGISKDFIQGDYLIPIRFVGNAKVAVSGKYFVRAYALIDNNNYWSDEKVFTVTAIPRHEIKIINYPDKVKLNENSAFTWEITGPPTSTGFTSIVGAKESKSGTLDESIDLSKTPYKILVRDFVNGTFTVPLRYVGNTVMPEYGTYYIRALTVINGKNIWSDEYNLSVQ